ncbi:uncharacterized protein LOC135372100 [Ornithodoros turicata]|uniref:uncharacterized protein LOC135372100 n=1 Tax=Ornithodoros turicata TaxID=34597 RepID=UPI0031389F25
MESAPAKKRRASTWSDEERLEFLQEVMDRRTVIRGKFSPSLTKKDKKAAWQQIADVLNARHPTTLRTVAELKKQWDNLCTRHRTIFSEFRRQSLQTGRGGNVSQPSAVTQAVIDIIGEDSPSITGVEGGMDTRGAAIIEDVIASLPGPSTSDDHDYGTAVQDVVPVVGLREDDNFVVTCKVGGTRGSASSQPFSGAGNGAEEQPARSSTSARSQRARRDSRENIERSYSGLLHKDTDTATMEQRLIEVRQRVSLEELELCHLRQETERLRQQTELLRHNTERLLQTKLELEVERLQQQQ